jgi:hypothetical protein
MAGRILRYLHKHSIDFPGKAFNYKNAVGVLELPGKIGMR